LGACHSSVQKAATKFGINLRKRSRRVKDSSKYEKEIYDWLNTLKVKFQHPDRIQLRPKELDFYFPESKLAIEFQGTFWHAHESMFKNETEIQPISGKSIKEIREADKLKAKLCEENGIDLFCIWEHEWKLNKEDIKKQILVKLGLV
jgi:G:T-mismatch repair DNA endonuclease (very short patch repair protein)